MRDHITIEDIVAAYVRDRESDGKSTLKMRTSWKTLATVFAALQPADIDKAVCHTYWRLREEAKCSRGTTWTDLSCLRAALNWALATKKIKEAPKIWLPQPPPPKDRHLTREEADRLLAAIDLPHLKLFVVLALMTGARTGAILELEWSRVDFDRGQIDLRAGECNEIKRRAVVPMNNTLRAALTEARAGALSNLVGLEWAGKRVGCVARGFASAAAKAGLTDIPPNVLRHTAAVWMAEAGVPMSEISQYLGHSSTAVTERVYARYSPNHLKGAARALELGLRAA